MKKILKVTMDEVNLWNGQRGLLGHSPAIGDLTARKFYLNGIHILDIIEGKSVNKYSGNYCSYEKVNNDNNSIEAIKDIMWAIENIEGKINKKLVKKDKLKDVATNIFNQIRYEALRIDIKVRKSNEFEGCLIKF